MTVLRTLPPLVPASGTSGKIPPLRNGDHLTAAEFHRRYEAMGEGVRAELIEGVVYIHSSSAMPSPVSLDRHGRPHFDLITWGGYYCSRTPGLLRGDNSTLLLDHDNEPQPDVLLAIPHAAGGTSKIIERNGKAYLAGMPEFVAEIAAASISIDLHAKLQAYERNGATEYLVVRTEDDPGVDWFVNVDGRLTRQDADEDGLFKSRVLPGLWLDADALLAGDLARLFAAVDRGCAADSHAEFTRRIAGQDSRSD